jgi:hypothetical protein
MRESHGEGIASHTGPESCVTVREDAGEALTGVRAGRVLSRERVQENGVPTPFIWPEGNIGRNAIASCGRTPAVGDLEHARKLFVGTWEIPRSTAAKMETAARIVNPTGMRR